MESVATDASVFVGNSGGPMITDDKHVVGILSWKSADTFGAGVASYLFKPILEYFASNFDGSLVSFPKGYLGAFYRYVNSILASSTLPTILMQGVRILQLDPLGAPENLAVGDIILEIDGLKIGKLNNQVPLFSEIHLRRPGAIVTIKYCTVENPTTVLTKQVKLLSVPPSKDSVEGLFRSRGPT